MSEKPTEEKKVATEENVAKKDEKGNKRKRIIEIILLIIIIILLLLLLKQCSKEEPILVPDYAPQELEQNAEEIGDDDDTKLEHEEGGGAVSLHFQNGVKVDLSDGQVSLFFANPSRSTQDMLLQIVVQNKLVAETGRLEPGNQIKTLTLEDGMSRVLQKGAYDGKFVIHYYDPVTNERAMVNTETPVTVTVVP